MVFSLRLREKVELFPKTKQKGKLSCGKAKLSNCAYPSDRFPIPVPVAKRGKMEIHLTIIQTKHVDYHTIKINYIS